MNEITFDIRHTEFGEVVVPEIDGRSLISIIRDVEMPFAKCESHPDIAGAYIGIPKNIAAPPSEHLVGKSTVEYRWSDKTILLVCKCGEPGCWPLEVRITVTPNSVEWGDFEQPHRQEWRYEQRFVFDKDQYDKAIAALA